MHQRTARKVVKIKYVSRKATNSTYKDYSNDGQMYTSLSKRIASRVKIYFKNCSWCLMCCRHISSSNKKASCWISLVCILLCVQSNCSMRKWCDNFFVIVMFPVEMYVQILMQNVESFITSLQNPYFAPSCLVENHFHRQNLIVKIYLRDDDVHDRQRVVGSRLDLVLLSARMSHDA